MKKSIILTAAAALALTATPAWAQVSNDNPFASIFGALFGDRAGVTTSIEAQWAAGQTPLANQRAAFESRVDTELANGSINQTTAARLKTDYYNLVVLESRYGADRRFTSAERTELADRYGTLTQVLADRGYADNGTITTAAVAEGRADFDARVNSAIAARRISRTAGTRLRSDYAGVMQVENTYLRDGVLSQAELADLDARLDALDVRLGDTRYGGTNVALTARQRLDAIGRAIPTVRLGRPAAAQLRVEYEDLTRLALAYERLAPTADDRAYLDSRLANLETRAGLAVANSNY
jgi:hypothetical protein